MLPGAVRRLDRPAVKPIMAIPRSPREGGRPAALPRDAMSDVEAHREQLPTRAVDRPDVPRTARRVERPDPRRCTSTSRPPLPGAARRSRRCTSTSRPPSCTAPSTGAARRPPGSRRHAARRPRSPARAPPVDFAGRPIRAPGLPGGARGHGPRSGPPAGPRLGPPAPRRPGASLPPVAAWPRPWTPSGRPYWALNGIDYCFTSI